MHDFELLGNYFFLLLIMRGGLKGRVKWGLLFALNEYHKLEHKGLGGGKKER